MTERPDGGWGWVIAIATFLTNVIVDGVKYSFGIMFVELVETFQKSKSETSWLMSIQVGIMLLSGPVVAALVNRFGCKTIALTGTFISFTGFLASTFVHSLYIMYLTFGLLAGLGFGMMVMPAVVMLARYFDKRLAFASGIAAMGSGFGTLVFNPLSKVLIDKYTWRGTLLIEAGIVLNGLVCALVMKSPKKISENMYVNEETIREDDKETKSVPAVDQYHGAPNNHSVDAQELLDVNIRSKVENVETNTYSHIVHKPIKSCKDTEDHIRYIESPHGNTMNLKEDTDQGEVKETYETDVDVTFPLITTTNEIMNKVNDSPLSISDTSKCENKCSKENDLTTMCADNDGKICQESSVEVFTRTDTTKTVKIHNTEVPSIEMKEETKFINYTNKTENVDNEKCETDNRRWFSLAPLKNTGFLVFLLSGILIEMSLNTPFIFLPDMMLHKGFEKQDAVWMLFIIGLVSTLSRIVIGFIADLQFVNRVKLCNSIVVLNGVFVVLCPFCSNYASFVAFSVLFGFSAGSSSSLRYVLIPDLFGIDMIADFFGINMFFSAFAAFIGLPKAGALYDATDNYMVPFVVAGAELTVSGSLLFLIPFVQSCSKVPLQTK
ncbi:uncharacterized protein LOC123554788 [Mercenaria mercenaria]|uniref:uncharacterized protein LOC123554788 n=1 Tax=Mercenaria mercenaria TaxID=6596 RepID=UPI00234F0DC0|nr:uncharacterized protein LOC123554788 [Mercenaria mercenaria]XP_045201071.2 uncharacterized protein LOC123554788 [Mercenaria mercenaria]XP_053403703.1 uncharacterized protein LOC123554788 [Mercenaria mercenaria]XP_053403704.1 uncharacterized protein LOC123554788 [Mercenaria mercenaria]